jgi:hypothetical protein
LKFHKELKLFALFKSLIRKTISNFLLFLEEPFEKIGSQNINLHLPKAMQTLLQRKYLQKVLYKIKFAFPKVILKYSSNIIIRVYFLFLKGITLKTKILFDLMQ